MGNSIKNRRLELHEKLESIIGVGHAYFQPPENITLSYPCIIYNIENGKSLYADDIPYAWGVRYNVILVDSDPDSDYVANLMKFPSCVYDTFYTADGLNHFSFRLYY